MCKILPRTSTFSLPDLLIDIHKKVNIRTILQSMMERLTNYYANASLLEGEEIYGVNGDISNVSFQIFDN